MHQTCFRISSRKQKASLISSYPHERYNKDLNAQNVIELDLNAETVSAGYAEVADLLDADFFEGPLTSPKSEIGLYAVCPSWNGDLRWISSGNKAGFDFFDRYFDLLDVAAKTKTVLGDLGELIMYSGFFVTRSLTESSYYHVDYMAEVGLNAFTLMTPVKPTGEIGNLLYHDAEGVEQVYKYSQGKAVSFGGGFYHSTEPFKSTEPYIFMCFTYGVTDMELWDSIAVTAAEQGMFYRHPQKGIVRCGETDS